MAFSLLVLLVVGGVFFYLNKNNPKAPEVETEKDLIEQGYSIKEAKEEARKQRREHREGVRTQNDCARTALSAGRLVKQIYKKGKK